jgi:hypothetical protein
VKIIEAIIDPYTKYRPAAKFCLEVIELIELNEAKDKLLNVQKNQMGKMLSLIAKHGLMGEYLGIKEE